MTMCFIYIKCPYNALKSVHRITFNKFSNNTIVLYHSILSGKNILKTLALNLKSGSNLLFINNGGIKGTFLLLQKLFKILQYGFEMIWVIQFWCYLVVIGIFSTKYKLWYFRYNIF